MDIASSDLIAQCSSVNTVVFPYPTNTNVGNFVNIKLCPKNFLLWEDQILNLIDSHGFWPFMNGTIAIPPKNVSITLPDKSIKETENPDYAAGERAHKLL